MLLDWNNVDVRLPDTDKRVEVVLDGGIRDWLYLDGSGNWYDFIEGKKKVVFHLNENIVAGWLPLRELPEWWV